jgi:hypothetical protein
MLAATAAVRYAEPSPTLSLPLAFRMVAAACPMLSLDLQPISCSPHARSARTAAVPNAELGLTLSRPLASLLRTAMTTAVSLAELVPP